MNVKIAVAQTDAAVGNLRKNVEHHIGYVRKAIARKAQIIVFPELSLTGYSVKDLNWDLAISTANPRELRELIRLSKSITIIAGGVEEAENFGIYNSAFVMEGGKLFTGHRKNYPPTYGMFEEMRYFNQGKEVRCFPSEYGLLGIVICEDLWHLPLPYILAHEGAHVIIGLAASPTRIAGARDELPTAVVNTEHHKTYARLLSTYLVFANRVGVEDGVNFWGGSHIVDPFGEITAEAKLFDEDLIVAEVDEERVRRARRFSRHFVDDSPEFTIQQLRRSLRRKNSL